MPKLFSTMTVKNLELRNRVVMPPMCTYSTDDQGRANDWHFVHYVTRAVGGVGLIIIEATGVERRGRITDTDLGLWEDGQVEGLKRIVTECQKYGAKVAIQLGHAGRKCSIPSEDLIAPSALPFDENYKTPRAMTKEDIRTVTESFRQAAFRVEQAGFDALEIHAAHGFLLSEFLSPLANRREDEYGGSHENRARFLKEVITAIRAVWPQEKPLIVRVSAEDYVSGGNHPEDLAKMINLVKSAGVDVVHVSSGAVVPAKINTYPGYQVKYAEIIKTMTGLPVIAGGLITSPFMAEEIIQNERADLVFLGRELLRNPYWPLQAAKELGQEIKWPFQYERSR